MSKFNTMKLLLGTAVAAGSILAAGATANSASSVAGVETTTVQRPSNYATCYRTRLITCYPVRDGGIYRPEPGTPEAEAFDQCAAQVAAGCAAEYPTG